MRLTRKEVTVLQLRSKGMTQAQIAKQLHVSQATISSCEKNAYHKVADAQAMMEFAKERAFSIPHSPYKKVRK